MRDSHSLLVILPNISDKKDFAQTLKKVIHPVAVNGRNISGLSAQTWS